MWFRELLELGFIFFIFWYCCAWDWNRMVSPSAGLAWAGSFCYLLQTSLVLACKRQKRGENSHLSDCLFTAFITRIIRTFWDDFITIHIKLLSVPWSWTGSRGILKWIMAKNGAIRHGDAIPCIAMSDYEDGVNLSINPPLITLSTSSTLYFVHFLKLYHKC